MAEFDPTLTQTQAIVAAFDLENDNAGSHYDDKELHVGFHILHAADKLLYGVKEKLDHPDAAVDDSTIDTEVIPDLLKFAFQLAEIRGNNVAELLLARLVSLEDRNSTPGSAERAINSILD